MVSSGPRGSPQFGNLHVVGGGVAMQCCQILKPQTKPCAMGWGWVWVPLPTPSPLCALPSPPLHFPCIAGWDLLWLPEVPDLDHWLNLAHGWTRHYPSGLLAKKRSVMLKLLVASYRDPFWDQHTIGKQNDNDVFATNCTFWQTEFSQLASEKLVGCTTLSRFWS